MSAIRLRFTRAVAISVMLGCFTLAACATKPPTTVPPVADPCPAEGLAELQAEPVSPESDPIELGRVYGAIAGVIGPDRAQALVRFLEADHPSWGRRGWERAKRVKEWCAAR